MRRSLPPRLPRVPGARRLPPGKLPGKLPGMPPGILPGKLPGLSLLQRNLGTRDFIIARI